MHRGNYAAIAVIVGTMLLNGVQFLYLIHEKEHSDEHVGDIKLPN